MHAEKYRLICFYFCYTFRDTCSNRAITSSIFFKKVGTTSNNTITLISPLLDKFFKIHTPLGFVCPTECISQNIMIHGILRFDKTI